MTSKDKQVGVRDDVKLSDGALDAVAYYRPETRYEPEERGFVSEWADIPTRIHDRAQVKWDGSAVRFKTNDRDDWQVTHGIKRGAENKPWTIRVQLNGVAYYIHRLVALSYLVQPQVASGRVVICHITARPPGDLPDDSFINLYWGTYGDNANDSSRAGLAQIGKRRYFRGWRYGSEADEFETFTTHEEAAEVVGVGRPWISKALADAGKRVGKDRWYFEYIKMDFSKGEKLEKIGRPTKYGQRFVTSFGRTGEFKRVKNGDVVKIVPVEIFYETDEQGYRVINGVPGYENRALLHRVIFEIFAREVIVEKEKATWMPWRGPNGHHLQVDHVNGDSLDNRIDNLSIVTPDEHNTKETSVRAVVEIDEMGIVKSEWSSVADVEKTTNIRQRTIHYACMRRGPLKNGRRFEFRDEFFGGETPTRKRKRCSRYSVDKKTVI
jgi:hypothetical protein